MALCTDVLTVIAGRSYLPEFLSLSSTCKEINQALEPMLHDYKAKINEIFEDSISDLTDRTNQARERLNGIASFDSLVKEERDVWNNIESLGEERNAIIDNISKYVFISIIEKIPLILKIIAFVKSLFPSLEIRAISEFQELKVKLRDNSIQANQLGEELNEIRSSINDKIHEFTAVNDHFYELDTKLENQILFTKMLETSLPMSNLIKIKTKVILSLDSLCYSINNPLRSTEEMKPNSQRIYIDSTGHRGLFFCNHREEISSIQEVVGPPNPIVETTQLRTYSSIKQDGSLYDPGKDYDFLNLNK